MNSPIVQLARRAREPQSLEKDEVLDTIFWFRQMVGFAVGLVAGCVGLTGYPVILAFAASLFGASTLFQSRFLQLDEDDYNPQELMMEGLGNSVGLFLLTWILLHTFL